ncbi:MAG: type II toxin-antitoxin system PemK/MazF family toxin [Thiobacillaceae bacterium]
MDDRMAFKRGDVVMMARASGAYLEKPRPVVIVQCNDCLELRESVTVCLFTKSAEGDVEFRPLVKKTAANGLKFDSVVEVDKVATLYRENIAGKPKGRLTSADMKNISSALAFWLGIP